MDNRPATKADLAELEARVVRRLWIVAAIIFCLTMTFIMVLP